MGVAQGNIWKICKSHNSEITYTEKYIDFEGIEVSFGADRFRNNPF